MTVFSEGLKAAFLDTLRETANVTVAARSVGISPATVYKHRKDDALFAERWDEAINEG
jgi:transposase-like protein